MTRRFIDHYGVKAQLQQLTKEAIELAHAINDYLDDKDTLDHVQEEMGDVLNLLDQFSEYWADGKLYCIIAEKRKRQMQKILNKT